MDAMKTQQQAKRETKIVYLHNDSGLTGDVVDCHGMLIGSYQVLRDWWQWTPGAGLNLYRACVVKLSDGSAWTGEHMSVWMEPMLLTAIGD
jgi:hypothetical protein